MSYHLIEKDLFGGDNVRLNCNTPWAKRNRNEHAKVLQIHRQTDGFKFDTSRSFKQHFLG